MQSGTLHERTPLELVYDDAVASPDVRPSIFSYEVEVAAIHPHAISKNMQSARSPEDVLEAWKLESDACAGVIFMSLPINGPAVSGTLKQEAVDAIMHVVWHRIDAPGKEEVLRKNLEDVKKHTADLVDKTVAWGWERAAA